MQYLSYAIFGGLITAGLYKKRSKPIAAALLVFMWILMAFNTRTPDFEAYKTIYYSNDNAQYFEIGFMGLCRFARLLGLGYTGFRALFAMLYMALAANYIFRSTENINTALIMFMICPMLYAVSGIRSALAYVIANNAVLLLNGKSRFAKPLFIGGIILAAAMHTSALFFIIYIFADKRFSWQRTAVLFGLELTVCLCFRSGLMVNAVIGVLNAFLPAGKAAKWLSHTSVHTYPNMVGVASVALFVLFYALYGYYLSRNTVVCSSFNDLPEDSKVSVKKDKVAFSGNLCLLSSLVAPLVFITQESIRLLFGSMLFFYITAVNTIPYTKNKYYKAFYIFATVSAMAASVAMYRYSYPQHDIFDVLYHNLLF